MEEIREQIKKAFTGLIESMRDNKALMLAVSALVVMITVYDLILPGMTLDRDNAVSVLAAQKRLQYHDWE